MLQLTGISNEIHNPLLKSYIDAHYVGLRVCGLFGNTPDKGYLSIPLNKKDVIEYLHEAKDWLEDEGANNGELVFGFDLIPQCPMPEAYPAIQENMHGLVKEAVADARDWGIAFPLDWSYRIERVPPDTKGKNELVLFPTNNYKLDIELYLRNEKGEFPVGGFVTHDFVVEGVISFQEYPYYEKGRAFRPRTWLLPINYQDTCFAPADQVRTGVLYNAISLHSADWLNQNAHGPDAPVVGEFGQARNTLVHQLIEAPISRVEKKDIVEMFYTDPLQLLELP